ncbi:DUF6090 family protein [Formosa maritima]|uniref:Uncharacterized protein n=1 Tax=Formosa maritima TaxID=2592046 RepID=A0A5D0GMZ1_9FLAO|nr:DUF6090 family protein [Formosa maritima]TYA59669.1 hypothetical protein FVF61_01045 [Formosa maritima]
MIKFFRRIRQNLLNEGKTTRYFKYAIGEIVLVVIGILIALQINNWNELRKTNIEEKSALDNIQRDFIKNKEILEDGINTSLLIINSGMEILNHTGKKSKPQNENILNKWLNDLFNSQPYYPQNGFLDDLLSSGKLGIFENVELRNLLSSWKPKVEVLAEKFESLNLNEDILNTYILEHGSWLNADAVSVEERVFKFPVSGFDVDNRDLLDALLFENLIENLTISADNYHTTQKETLKLLDEIIMVLEHEIINSND